MKFIWNTNDHCFMLPFQLKTVQSFAVCSGLEQQSMSATNLNVTTTNHLVPLRIDVQYMMRMGHHFRSTCSVDQMIVLFFAIQTNAIHV